MYGAFLDHDLPNKYARYGEAGSLRGRRHEPVQLELCIHGWRGFEQPIQLPYTCHSRKHLPRLSSRIQLTSSARLQRCQIASSIQRLALHLTTT